MRYFVTIICCLILLWTGLTAWLVAADEPTTKHADHETSPLTLHINSAKLRYEAGEALDVVLILHNRSNQRVVMFDEEASLDFRINVHWRTGEEVGTTRRCGQISKRSVLDKREAAIVPNEQRQYVIRVNRLFDLSTTGEYVITAHRDFGFLAKKGFSVTSNKLPFYIEEPDLPPGRPVGE